MVASSVAEGAERFLQAREIGRVIFDSLWDLNELVDQFFTEGADVSGFPYDVAAEKAERAGEALRAVGAMRA